jgi:steroid delta-isomerase-like uncharacterized protein
MATRHGNPSVGNSQQSTGRNEDDAQHVEKLRGHIAMRNTLLLILSLLALLPARLAASDVQTQNKAVARRVFEEIFNQGKFEVADEIYAGNFVNHGVKRDADLKEDQAAARGWKLAFPDLKMTVAQEIAEGDLVTVLWTATGTNTGEGNGLPATGKQIQGRGITIWRIVNGKITEEWSEFDQLRIMKELGLLPASTK